MLEYLRERMGVLLWVVLILVIGGFVFMSAGDNISFDFTSSLYVVDDETVTDYEMKQFAKKHYAQYLYTDLDSLRQEINRELESPNPDDKTVQDLQKQIEEIQNELDRMATFMAWDQELKKDGVRVSRDQAVDYLKDNPTQSWLELKSDGGNLLEGMELSPRGESLLESFRYKHSLDLHSNLYQSCISLPVALTYSGKGQPYGFRYDSLHLKVDYIYLDENDLEPMKVTYDNTSLKNFYTRYQNIDKSDQRLGYKNPGKYSLTCLTAVSQDFTTGIDIDVIELRKYYETHKYSHWTISADDEKYTPFHEVREEVIKHYLLSEGKTQAKEFLEDILIQWQSGTSEQELQKNDSLQLHTFEKLTKNDLDWLPDLDGVFNNAGLDQLEEGQIHGEVVTYANGAAIYRLDHKIAATAPTLEDIKEDVVKDYLSQKRLEKARQLLQAFKRNWDKNQDWQQASDAVTSDAIKIAGIETFDPPKKLNLGTIRISDSPEALEGFYHLQPQLFRNVFSQRSFSTNVEMNYAKSQTFLLIAPEHFYGATNTQGETFDQVYLETYQKGQSSLLRSFKADYAADLFESRVKRLH